ncbi:MAG: PAS domain S-box protein [Candidatus Tectomicrobia bacterium]|nr:PAS domain S-box protein [Candidatus Tectomicrobia bacterium]
MDASDSTREELIADNTTPRQCVAMSEAAAITHRQVEATLQKSEHRYHRLMEHSPGLLYIHDLDGILLEVNPAAAQALGYPPQDGVGWSLREFLAPAALHQFDAYLERIQQQPTDNGLLRVITRTGEERVWLYQNVRHKAPYEAPYVASHALDITEHIQALLQAERLAALGTLAAGMAHELNNPLAAITVTAEHARNALTGLDIPEEVRTCLDDILNDANRCAQTIKRTLRCVREGDLAKTVVDLHPLIETACTMTQSYAKQHDVQLTLALAPASLRIRANADEMELALVNLIRNAVASGQNGAQVSLRTKVEATQVHITVQDTSVGRTEETQQYAFNPFYRARQNIGGTRLGLSITHRIITNHQGKMDLRSRPRQGTIVRISLPLVA